MSLKRILLIEVTILERFIIHLIQPSYIKRTQTVPFFGPWFVKKKRQEKLSTKTAAFTGKYQYS